jgi:glutathione S-transferase
MSSRPSLYQEPFSHYCVSADRMLAFKGIAYEPIAVTYHDKRDLIAATGQDYVPTLMWEGKPVFWYDLADFLERVRPKPTLYPKGQKGLAVVLEHWGHQVLEEHVWRYVVTKVPPRLADFGIYGGMYPLLFVGEKVPKTLPRLAKWVDRIAKIRA